MKIITFVLILRVLLACSGQIIINKTILDGRLVIECTTSSSLTFKFRGYQSDTAVNIAQCEHILSRCYLFDSNQRSTYETSYSRHGGLLRFIHLERDVWGTYTCCDAYKHDICNSTDVYGTITSIPTTNTRSSAATQGSTFNDVKTMSKPKDSAENSHLLPLVAGVVGASVGVAAIIIASVAIYRTKRIDRRTRYRQQASETQEQNRKSIRKKVTKSVSNYTRAHLWKSTTV